MNDDGARMIKAWADFRGHTPALVETIAEVVLAFQTMTRYHNCLAIYGKLQSLHFPERLAAWIAFRLPDWVIERFKELNYVNF